MTTTMTNHDNEVEHGDDDTVVMMATMTKRERRKSLLYATSMAPSILHKVNEGIESLTTYMIPVISRNFGLYLCNEFPIYHRP